MATKLKNLKITKVDFVDDGANPEAHIKLFKNKDGKTEPMEDEAEKNPNFWKRLLAMIKKAAEPDGEGTGEIDGIQKSGAVGFGEKINETKNRKIADEIWDICYALQSSLCSILNDEELDGANASTAMQESLNEFSEFVSTAIAQWSTGKAASIVRKETEVTSAEMDMMKYNRDRLNETIEKSVVKEEQPKGPEENNIAKGATEMKIDKSKLTDAERAFLDEIEKRCGEEDGTGSEGTGAPAPAQAPTTPEGGTVEKSNTVPAVPEVNEGVEDVYKNIHPAVKAELEALKKFRQDAEDREVREVAKRYAIIGKKEDELFPVLKGLKAAGGTAYTDMITILDQAVETVEKSGAFTEIGKSGGNGMTDGAAWAKAEQQAMEIMKSKKVTKNQALDEVFMNDPELARECEKED